MTRNGDLALRRVSIGSLAVIALASGCAARGEPRDSGPGSAQALRPAIEAIALCRTTEAELRQSLGAPTRDGRLRDARILSWIVGDQGDDGVVHYVAVMLDAGGRVVDLYWDVPSEIPWAPADQCKGR